MNLSISTLNVRSIVKEERMQHAIDYFNRSDAQITILTETWLRKPITNTIDNIHIAQSPPMHNQGIVILAKRTIKQFQPVFPSLWTPNTVAVKIL